MFDRIPFIRYILFLLTGIFSGDFFRLSDPAVSDSIFFACILLVILVMIFTSSRHIVAKISLAISLILLGWFSANRQVVRFEKSLSEIENQEYDAFLASVTSLPEKKEKSVRYEAQIEFLLSSSGTKSVSSKSLVYFKSDQEILPSVGDRLLIFGQLRRPQQAGSSYQFDYRKYLERKGIPWTTYISDREKVIFLPELSSKTSFATWPARLSEETDILFRTYIRDDDAYGLTKAMILGRRDDIRAELNSSFINSGTVHILSVSGLHIAIFFAVLHFVLGPLRKRRWGTYLYLVLMTGILTGYAIVTGLPASVQRATIMCIIWLIASTFSRRQEPINTLAIAAFIILLADPASFYDVGFQLSFLAMLGIFLWSKPISNLYTATNRITQHFWSLTVMSVAAQLMTLPLTIYYFNQFPTYFLFSNLLAVDISGLLIPASFALMVCGFMGFEWLSSLLGTLLNYLGIIVNSVVELPENLPHYLFSHLYLDLVQAILLLAVILSLYAALTIRKGKYVRYVFFTIVAFSLYSSIIHINHYRATFVNSAGNGSAIVYKSGQRLYFFENGDNRISNYELSKYMARYGKDTVRVRIN